MKKYAFTAFVLLLSMTLLAACGSQPGPQEAAAPNTNTNATTNNGANEESEDDPNNLTYEELIEKAKEDGELVIYGSSSPERFSIVQEAFDKQFGIKITYTRVIGGESYNRVVAEHDSGKVLADIVNQGDTSILNALVDKGYARKLHFVVPDMADEANALTDGYTFYHTISPTGIVYDSSRIGEPKSWKDLLAPELKGQVALADPSLVNTKIALLLALQDEYGEDFVKELGKQIKIYKEDPLVVNNVLGKEVIAGITYPSIALPLIKDNPNIKYTHNLDLVTGPAQVNLVLERGPNPYAAVLYANWVFSVEGQQALNGNNLGITPLNSTQIDGVEAISGKFVLADYDRAMEEKESVLELFQAQN